MKNHSFIDGIDLKKKYCRVSYRHLFSVAFPLIIQALIITIMTLTDRIFMSYYDISQFSAITPAFSVGFTIGSFFNGIVSFVSTLVAHYYGAGNQDKLKISIWQSIIFSFISCLFLAITMPFVSGIFRFFEHSSDLIEYETIYVRFMIITIMIGLFTSTMGGYFAGIGRTGIVMWGTIAGSIVNLVLDFWFIFGGLGVPAMGITGAGFATILGAFVSFLVTLIFFIFDGLYGTGKNYRLLTPVFDIAMMRKLLYFGLPSAMQLVMDAGGFSIMLMFMGKLGSIPTIAASMAISLQLFSYLPIVNFSTACGILVGQERGAKNLGNITILVKKTMGLCLFFNFFLTLIFLLWPNLLMIPFSGTMESVELDQVVVYFRPMLMVVCSWLIIDSILNVYLHVLKSLGDTIFIMLSYLVIIPLFYILPAWMATTLWRDPIVLFATTVLYVFASSVIFSLRYHSGVWKKIHVISV